jgi:hypothetical protein
LRTDDAIYKVTTEILNSMNNKLAVGGIFCVLEKAFDCVAHEMLLFKLKFYGINGKNLALYQTYLDNGCLRMLIHNDSDNKVSGQTKSIMVSHKGVFWDLYLFLIYTNDLPKLIYKTSLPILFGDHISILFTQPN